MPTDINSILVLFCLIGGPLLCIITMAVAKIFGE
jgi:hypothetical protein